VIALFLALALDPLVGWLQRRGRLGRAPAIAVTYLALILVIAAVGASFIPKLTEEVNGFVQASPTYVHDLTHGRGRLGFLETKYHVVEKVQAAGQEGRHREGARPLGRGALGHEKHHHDHRRDRDDRLPDVLHAPRGRRLGRPLLLTFPGGFEAALATRRPRHLQDGPAAT